MYKYVIFIIIMNQWKINRLIIALDMSDSVLFNSSSIAENLLTTLWTWTRLLSVPTVNTCASNSQTLLNEFHIFHFFIIKNHTYLSLYVFSLDLPSFIFTSSAKQFALLSKYWQRLRNMKVSRLRSVHLRPPPVKPGPPLWPQQQRLLHVCKRFAPKPTGHFCCCSVLVVNDPQYSKISLLLFIRLPPSSPHTHAAAASSAARYEAFIPNTWRVRHRDPATRARRD